MFRTSRAIGTVYLDLPIKFPEIPRRLLCVVEGVGAKQGWAEEDQGHINLKRLKNPVKLAHYYRSVLGRIGDSRDEERALHQVLESRGPTRIHEDTLTVVGPSRIGLGLRLYTNPNVGYNADMAKQLRVFIRKKQRLYRLKKLAELALRASCLMSTLTIEENDPNYLPEDPGKVIVSVGDIVELVFVKKTKNISHLNNTHYWVFERIVHDPTTVVHRLG